MSFCTICGQDHDTTACPRPNSTTSPEEVTVVEHPTVEERVEALERRVADLEIRLAQRDLLLGSPRIEGSL